MQAVDGDVNAGFLVDLALRAHGGRFALGGVEFAADGRVEALVGILGAADEEEAAGGVAQVAEDGDFVGVGGAMGRRGFGHAGR